MRQEAGGRREEGGGKRQEAGGTRHQAGGRRQEEARQVEPGGKKTRMRQEGGGRRQEGRGRRQEEAVVVGGKTMSDTEYAADVRRHQQSLPRQQHQTLTHKH